MTEFTPTQGRYLSYIHAYTTGFGLPPAESEIAAAMEVSPPSVNQMMKMLQKKGLIHREPGVARSTQILINESSIPKWNGKQIVRVVTEWVRSTPTAMPPSKTYTARQSSKQPAKVFVFKITLNGSKPPIWRRIETGDVSMEILHELIQIAMGWASSHMHQFRIRGECWSAPFAVQNGMMDWANDYTGITISKLISAYGTKLKMRYEYDFGDGWEHTVALERVIKPESDITYPRCTAGKGACPPEDIGGIYGYYNFVEAVNDPKHPRHEEYIEWHGPFDPSDFDKDETTLAMQNILPGNTPR